MLVKLASYPFPRLLLTLHVLPDGSGGFYRRSGITDRLEDNCYFARRIWTHSWSDMPAIRSRKSYRGRRGHSISTRLLTGHWLTWDFQRVGGEKSHHLLLVGYKGDLFQVLANERGGSGHAHHSIRSGIVYHASDNLSTTSFLESTLAHNSHRLLSGAMVPSYRSSKAFLAWSLSWMY